MHARAVAAALLAFGVSAARANSESDIPPECGNRAAFDRALRERLGDDAPTHQVAVSISRAHTRSHLRVQMGTEVRELDDASCTELFRASIVIAVAMLGREPPQSPAAPPSREREPSSPHYPRFSLGAGAGLNVGTLPAPVLTLELESKLLWRYLGAAVGVRYLLPAERNTAEGDKGVQLQALGVAASGIFRPSQRWEARLGVAAQRLTGEGTGSITRHDSDSAWAAGPTLGLAYMPVQTRRFWAGVGAEGQLNVVRGHFEILHYYRPRSEDPYVVYQVPWLAGSAFVRWGVVW